MPIKVAKIKKQKPEDPRPFILCDLRGEVIESGSTVCIASGSSYSAWLTIGIITRIVKCPVTVRIYMKKFGEEWEWNTYTSLDYSDSGKPCNKILSMANIEFDVDKKNFGKLLVAKVDYDNENPKVEAPEPPEPEDDEL